MQDNRDNNIPSLLVHPDSLPTNHQRSLVSLPPMSFQEFSDLVLETENTRIHEPTFESGDQASTPRSSIILGIRHTRPLTCGVAYDRI